MHALSNHLIMALRLKARSLLMRSRAVNYFSTGLRSGMLASVRAGDPLPDVTVYGKTPEEAINISELFKGKKGVIFSVVGAFTPGCSMGHIPEYLNSYERFCKEGYCLVTCISVNDPFVMAAWAKDVNADEKITMLADMKGEFTKAIGMELDATKILGNVRSQRYSLIINDGIISHVNHEDDDGLSCFLCLRKMSRREDIVPHPATASSST